MLLFLDWYAIGESVFVLAVALMGGPIYANG